MIFAPYKQGGLLMPINPSINDIMRDMFPFLRKILSPAQLVTSFHAFDSLPPQILMDGSHSVQSSKYRLAREKKIYLISSDNQIIAIAPEGIVFPDFEANSGPITVAGYIVGHSELLCMTILKYLDQNIQYVVVVETIFRIEGFEKNLDERTVEIFEVDPDTLEKDCLRAQQEVELRKKGKGPADMN